MATTTTTSTPNSGLGPKKTMFIMVTVVGCVAILWPKIFYPMMMGNVPPNKNVKDHRGAGCCGVVLDTEVYANTTLPIGNFSVRKSLNLITLEVTSIRQERPPHLHPDAIHPAMRERGRAIPPTHTVPIMDRPHAPPMPPRIVDGRPGPIPGMRPPMGGGSHQAPAKTSSMGLIMPLYTVGIVSFFIYTIMKLICKKTTTTPPYAEVKPDETFRQEVFGADHQYIKRPDDGSTKLVVTAIQGLIDAADEQIKKNQTTDLSKKQATEKSQNGQIHTTTNNQETTTEDVKKAERHEKEGEKKEVHIVGMEMTASCEGGKKWSRPGTPDLAATHSHPKEEFHPVAQAIYLEGALPHESQILVAESETKPEQVIINDDDYEVDETEPPVVLNCKMTLSLINLDHMEKDALKEHAPGPDKELYVVDNKIEDTTEEVLKEVLKVEDEPVIEEDVDEIQNDAEKLLTAIENGHHSDDGGDIDDETKLPTKETLVNEE